MLDLLRFPRDPLPADLALPADPLRDLPAGLLDLLLADLPLGAGLTDLLLALPDFALPAGLTDLLLTLPDFALPAGLTDLLLALPDLALPAGVTDLLLPLAGEPDRLFCECTLAERLLER